MIDYLVYVDLTRRHSADLLIGEFCHHVTARAEVTLYEVKMSPQHLGVTCPHLSERGTIMWLYPLLSSDWWTAACSNYDEWFNNKTFMRCKQTWSVSGVLCLFFSDRPKVATIKKTLKFVFTLQRPKSLRGVTRIGAFSFPRQSAQGPKILHKTSYAKWEKLSHYAVQS